MKSIKERASEVFESAMREREKHVQMLREEEEKRKKRVNELRDKNNEIVEAIYDAIFSKIKMRNSPFYLDKSSSYYTIFHCANNADKIVLTTFPDSCSDSIFDQIVRHKGELDSERILEKISEFILDGTYVRN